MRRYGLPNCIHNIQIFIDMMDNIFESRNDTARTQLKTAFNAQSLRLDTDFAIMMSSISSTWQAQSWQYDYKLTGPNSFCGNITADTNVFGNEELSAAARDILRNGGYASRSEELLTPLLNFIGTTKGLYVDFCKPDAAACYSSEQTNQPYPYPYLTCMEQGTFVTGYRVGDRGRPKELPIVSRLLTREYYMETCRTTYNLSSDWKGPDIGWSLKSGGWKMEYPKLMLSVGELDNLRPLTPLAEFVSKDGDKNEDPYTENPRLSCQKGNGVGRCNGTDGQPQIVIEGALHEWDLSGVAPKDVNATYPPPVVKMAQAREVAAVKGWFEEWKKEHAKGG